MRVTRVIEKFNSGDTFNYWPISDTHIGAADCDEEILREHIAEIAADPMARWTFGGDIGDLIDHRDRRMHPGMWPQRYQDAMFAEGGIPQETIEHAIELFEPIKKKCWAWLSGNHERTIRQKYDREIGSEISGRLGVAYLGYGGFVKVTWKRVSGKAAGGECNTVIDIHHGWQGGRRDGAKLNQLELTLSESDADMVMRGHSHTKLAPPPIDAFKVVGDNVRDWPRVVAHTGTYKLGRVEHERGEVHDTWEHTRGFRHKMSSKLGPPVIQISPQQHAQTRNRTSPLVKYRIIQ